MSTLFGHKQQVALPPNDPPRNPTPTALEKALVQYSDALDRMTAQLSKQVEIYRAIVARNEFEVFKLEHVFDWAMGGIATITLSGRVNQLIVFDRLFFSVPAATTSLQVQVGREFVPLFFGSGSSYSNTLPVQFIVGGADTIKATITPVPAAVSGANTPAWCFGLFGHKSGNTQEI